MANVIISGASRGIGKELARQYAEAGDRVYAFCRSPEKATDLNAMAKASNGKITVHAMDAGDGKSVAAAKSVVGDAPVDVLLNVAGIIGGEKQGLLDQNFDDWHEAFEVMTVGPFRIAQTFLPNLEKAKGKVMTVTSQLGASTWPMGGYYSYGASKAAVNRVMRSMAFDLKDKGVYVGVVHPGHVKTDMGGEGAEIEVQESASGIRNVTSNLTADNTGGFFKWNGQAHPW